MSAPAAIAARVRALGPRRRRRRRARAGPLARLPRGLAALALVAALAGGGGYLWLRDSGLVAVSDVWVTGVSGRDAPAIRRALGAAAKDMTTMHVRLDQLRTAVGPYPIVKDLRVETDFPHGMRIHVVEHDPVAAVLVAGRRVPVAADGTLLDGQPAGSQLVLLDIPSANGGGRLTDRRALAAVKVMGAAPPKLRGFVTGITRGAEGLTVSLRDGPIVQFGDSARPRAKWAAAARVLADPRSAGASYLDVRAPERPVAGRFAYPSGDVPLDGPNLDSTSSQAAEDSTTG
jgi:cell division protein FtsQ